MAQNPMVDVLRYYGSPVNRQEYINTAYMGKPPARLDPESEAELPQNDSRFMAFRPTTHEEIAAEEAAKEAKKPTIKEAWFEGRVPAMPGHSQSDYNLESAATKAAGVIGIERSGTAGVALVLENGEVVIVPEHRVNYLRLG